MVEFKDCNSLSLVRVQYFDVPLVRLRDHFIKLSVLRGHLRC
jgi:hypothetical protein